MEKNPVLFNKTLVFVTIILLVGICANPSFGIIVESESNNPITKGNTLYVGGIGPGNYTSIQDAINDASDFDKVFVFDDSSPYYENILVKKSITIQGENRYTTIIDGTNKSHGVKIIADSVTVTGFTIKNCSGLFKFTSGILLSSNNNKIIDNILIQNQYGIRNKINYSVPPGNKDNTITNNQIIHNHWGIYFTSVLNCTISRNIISQNDEGIVLMGAINANIAYNIISQNAGGIMIALYSYNTVVYRNNISYNNGGVTTIGTSGDRILQNNFIGNKKYSAQTTQRFSWTIMNLMYIKINPEMPIHIRRNVWNGNYWNKTRSSPYIIPGWFVLRFWIDWHPAKEPYDI